MREKLTLTKAREDLKTLPENYRTADVDRLIDDYVRRKLDLSALRSRVLSEQELHRIYFHGSLRQIGDPDKRLEWIHRNLLFSDWWHTDENINFVKNADFGRAYSHALEYVASEYPFIKRWGYVLFISAPMCSDPTHLMPLFALMRNDDRYYVQMAEAWLLAELAVYFPEEVLAYLPASALFYNVTGKAVQKICDSYRISDDYKQKFKSLRSLLKTI